jgi:hypothetical protein
LQKERGYKIIESEARGIYYIVGEGQFSAYVPAMQLAVSSELSAEDLEWVGAIRNDLTAEYGVKLAGKPEVVGEDAPLREFMRSLYFANHNIWEEMENMTVAEKKFRKYIDGWAVRSGAAEEWKQEGRQEGWQEGIEEERRKNAKAMKAEGIDANTIIKITGLTLDDIQKL